MPLASPDSLNDEITFVPPHTLSLLSVRRPSLAGPVESLTSFHAPTSDNARADEDFFRSPSVQDSRPNVPDFSRELQIKMQAWVGDGSCKMSISPSGRDIVLAARSGLYIIDLEAPLEVPRFLPQGGTWDVADVQWNPHPFRANYVVSTSSEKLLIWNLDRPDREAIQFILPRHYRSITDLNWHNHNPEIVASISIDSWIWTWDLRTPARPVTGLCAFNAGATQVKWNRHNENILASSHGNVVLIWDQRRGAVPLTSIKAHTARIYGIDWSRLDQHEIVSCSLDRTIKFWNTSASDMGAGDTIPRPLTESPTHSPRQQIDTKYPVWRARHTPFGSGVLSLPLRGMQRPELYYEDRSISIMPDGVPDEWQPDVIKEYVWRTKGGYNMDFDDREFQLITWSEDRTLHAWTMDVATLERAGFVHGTRIQDPSHRPTYNYESYRAISLSSDDASVPATIKSRERVGGATTLNSVLPSNQKKTTMETIPRGGTMTKGTGKSKRRNMHVLEWMPSVTVGEKKEGSVPISLESSYISTEQLCDPSRQDRGSQSPQVTPISEGIESETSPSWAEELTFVINGLSNSRMAKITLEKMDFKSRTCTLGFQGPWGETSSVFTRITFTFPRDYPRSTAPGSLPQFDLERNHLIPVKRRAFLLRELRALCKKPPCLEACLRFLLGLPTRRGITGQLTDSGSSSEGDEVVKPSKESVTVRGQTGLAEPRTSQGVFAPTGEIVFFSHLPLRMMQTMGDSPPRTVPVSVRETPEINRSSGMLSDALRRLTAAAHDRHAAPSVMTGAEEDLIRTLESLAQPKNHLSSEGSQASEVRDSTFLVRPVRKSRVTIRDVSEITGIDKVVAQEYVLSPVDPGNFCLSNASIARAFGRLDHERIFVTLHALFTGLATRQNDSTGWRKSPLARSIISFYLEELHVKKDVVMLAMISIMLFSLEKNSQDSGIYVASSTESQQMDRQLNRSTFSSDYFDIPRDVAPSRMRASSNASYVSQPPLRSPVSPGPPNSLSSSVSSRSSWSSIANGVRFLVGGQDGSLTPKPHGSPVQRSHTLPVISDTPLRIEGFIAGPKTPESTDRMYPPLSNGPRKYSATLKSSSEPVAPPSYNPVRVSVSFSSAGHQDYRETTNSRLVEEPQKRLSVVFEADTLKEEVAEDTSFVRLLELELLKCLPNNVSVALEDNKKEEGLVPVSLCKRCGTELGQFASVYCSVCGPRSEKPSCTVCRLPTTGLSHVCLLCSHSTHLRCWQSRQVKSCPTGCGCDCLAGGNFAVDVP